MNLLSSDFVLRRIIRRANDDAETVGLILSGSRGPGLEDDESDYDLEWVLTDAAYERRFRDGGSAREKRVEDGALLDIGYTCPKELARIAQNPGWWTPGYVMARVLLDKSGEVGLALQAIGTMPEERAQRDAAGWYDAYLNAYYRSIKAWRRGNELGGRLQAAESLMHLIRTLFALERRWPPYHDRLVAQLHLLDAQGWPPGFLRSALLEILRTGSPEIQQRLEAQVETLMRTRSFGHVIDGWDGEIQRVRAFPFNEVT